MTDGFGSCGVLATGRTPSSGNHSARSVVNTPSSGTHPARGEVVNSVFPARAAVENLEHVLTHMPTDDRCEHCVLGKTQSIRTCARSFGRTTSRFGGIVTAYHTSFTEHDGCHGCVLPQDPEINTEGSCGCVCVWVGGGAYPSDTTHSDAVREDLDNYLGKARVRTFFSDNARDIVKDGTGPRTRGAPPVRPAMHAADECDRREGSPRGPARHPDEAGPGGAARLLLEPRGTLLLPAPQY